MQSKLQKDYIKISDLGCAASIISTGFKIEFLDKTNPKKVLFAFIDSQEITKVATAYWNNELTVDAQTFFNNLKRLKNQLYSE